MRKRELAKAVTLLERGDWQAAHWYRRAKRAFPKSPSVEEEIASLRAELQGTRPGASE